MPAMIDFTRLRNSRSLGFVKPVGQRTQSQPDTEVNPSRGKIRLQFWMNRTLHVYYCTYMPVYPYSIIK
jgi:hypothetical protein